LNHNIRIIDHLKNGRYNAIILEWSLLNTPNKKKLILSLFDGLSEYEINEHIKNLSVFNEYVSEEMITLYNLSFLNKEKKIEINNIIFDINKIIIAMKEDESVVDQFVEILINDDGGTSEELLNEIAKSDIPGSKELFLKIVEKAKGEMVVDNNFSDKFEEIIDVLESTNSFLDSEECKQVFNEIAPDIIEKVFDLAKPLREVFSVKLEEALTEKNKLISNLIIDFKRRLSESEAFDEDMIDDLTVSYFEKLTKNESSYIGNVISLMQENMKKNRN